MADQRGGDEYLFKVLVVGEVTHSRTATTSIFRISAILHLTDTRAGGRRQDKSCAALRL